MIASRQKTTTIWIYVGKHYHNINKLKLFGNASIYVFMGHFDAYNKCGHVFLMKITRHMLHESMVKIVSCFTIVTIKT